MKKKANTYPKNDGLPSTAQEGAVLPECWEQSTSTVGEEQKHSTKYVLDLDVDSEDEVQRKFYGVRSYCCAPSDDT